MNEQIPLTDQLANISPAIIVAVVAGFTVVRLALKNIHDSWARTVSETCDTVNFVLVLAFLLIRPFLAQAFYIPSESMLETLRISDRLIVDKVSYRFRDPQRGDVLVFAAPPEATGSPKLEQDYIKRLIGMPGERIEVRGAHLKVGPEDIGPSPDNTDDRYDQVHLELREKLGIPEEQSVKIFPDYVLVNGARKVSKDEIARAFAQPGASVELIPGQVYINGKPLDDPYSREDPGYNEPELTIPAGHYFMMGDNRNHSQDSHAWGTLEKWRIVGHGIVTFWPLNRIGRIR